MHQRRMVLGVARTSNGDHNPRACTVSKFAASEVGWAAGRRGIEYAVSVELSSAESARVAALETLVRSAAANIPGVDFASITIRSKDDSLQIVASTDQLADRIDDLQYKLHEGPCYAAVNDERLVLVNDLWTSSDFPRYGAEATDIGLGAQLAIQLLHDKGERGGAEPVRLPSRSV